MKRTRVLSSPWRFGLLLAALAAAGPASAVDYSLPADIGSGAFSSCSGGGPTYTCSGDIELANGDTVTLTANVTLDIAGDLVIGNNVVLGGGGFDLTVLVDGDIDVGNGAVVNADMTATGNIGFGNNAGIDGDISAGGDVDIGNNADITGNVDAAGDVDIGNNADVTGNITADGNLDIGNNSTIDGVCTPPHPSCSGVPPAALDHFRITPAATAASTCFANRVTIVAENAGNQPLVNYGGAVSVTTSSAHGNWSVFDGAGTLSPNPDSDDDGAAAYQFVAADGGDIVLDLANTHAETLTITVSDAAAGVASTSVAITFASNVFVFTEDPVQVAGRPQTITVAMWTDDAAGSATCDIDPNYDYAGLQIDASLTREPADPGGAAPSIGGVSIPDAAASNPVTLDFSLTPGQAVFDLDSSDVGQYRLTLTDNTNTHGDTPITGSSAVLTVRPFGLAVTNVNAAGTAISTPPTDPDSLDPFAAAGADFAATVTAVLWSAADDTDDDGVLDAGTYTDNPAAPSYAWSTDLSVSAIGTEHWPTAVEGGVPGLLANGNLAAGLFAGGAQTVANLQYSEVGAFTLRVTASNYLGAGGPDIVGNGVVVGRFTPFEFELTPIADGTLLDANLAGAAFTYVGQPFGYDPLDRPAFRVTALSTGVNAGTTVNYIGDWSKMDVANTVFTPPDADVTLGYPLTYTQPGGFAFTPVAIAGNPGTFRVDFGDDEYVYDRDVVPLAPFDSAIALQIVSIADPDGVGSNGPLVLTPSSIPLRYGRLRLENALGSELSNLDMPLNFEYYDPLGPTARWTRHDDRDSLVPLADISLSAGVTTPLAITAPPATPGQRLLELQATNVEITETVGVLLGNSGQTWLRYDWDGDLVAEDPTALATFGVYEGNPAQIYLQQTFLP